MKRWLTILLANCTGLITSLVVLFSHFTAENTCVFMVYQPDMPEELCK